MRYAIFSDVHSNLEAWEAVLGAYKKEAIDCYICAGDIVGYATNPHECIRIIKEISHISVAGNHDWASVGLFSLDYLNSLAKKAVIWTKERLTDEEKDYLSSLKPVFMNDDLALVHGSLNSPEEFLYITDVKSAEECFRFLRNQVCFVGHLHISGVFIKDKMGRIFYKQFSYLKIEKENKYIINVGSVGQPRDGNRQACYCIYDTAKNEVWIKRIDYDIKSAYNKIIEAGLPLFLAQRLYLGR